MKLFGVVAVVLCVASANAIGSLQKITKPVKACEECGLTPSQLIEYWGYPVEEHIITCADGFPIRLLRIPYGLSAKAKAIPMSQTRPAVLLQHGLLDASTTWILNLPHQSLAFILADEGFDVWLGNNRGNTWSPPACDTEECWAFSFDDMAKYDLPANVDYILQRTGLPSIGYVGHSQGTIQAFAAFSQSDELQTKINVFAALAPVAYVYHQQSKLVSYLAALDVDKVFQLFGLKDFLPSSALIRFLGGFCPLPVIDAACEDVLFVLCGNDPEKANNLNGTRMDVYVSHTPAGTSVQNMAHWAQMVRDNRFGMYDWGSADENMKKYNQSTPPNYDITRIKLPVALFTGGNDLLADPEDVEKLEALLTPNSNIVFNQMVDYYEHLDFVWGLDAHKVIYPNVLSVLRKYANVTIQ
eukprot:TRINITY_DN77878_c0_g1_i1.p1 TRINITY_DN77878_c0_g1~~TRINITY_DN77878_c0_g1_i1.p1  ORF type:complete len:413 (-),score=120.90 TRINITY_DN77878_c0_g1_i1:32-1270(-)